MTEQYFYLKQHDRITGPFSAARLQALKEDEMLAPDAELSPDQQSWFPATQMVLQEEPPPAEPGPIRLRKKAATPEMKNPEPEASRGIPGESDAIRRKPVCNDRKPVPEPELSLTRLVGDALQLGWNTADNLLPLRCSAGIRRTRTAILTTLAGSLLLSLLTGLTGSLISGFSLPAGLGIGALIFVVLLGGLFLEIWSFRIIFSNDYRDGNSLDDLLMASTVLWIFSLANLTGGATVFYLVFPPSAAVGIIAALFNLLIWSFAVGNAATALRIGLCRFSGFRPRNAVWQAAAVIWSNLALLYLIVYFLIRPGRGR